MMLRHVESNEGGFQKLGRSSKAAIYNLLTLISGTCTARIRARVDVRGGVMG